MTTDQVGQKKLELILAAVVLGIFFISASCQILAIPTQENTPSNWRIHSLGPILSSKVYSTKRCFGLQFFLHWDSNVFPP